MENKLQAFARLWSNLTPPQRVIVTFFGAGVVVAAVAVAMVATRPDYTVLFANLKPEDASSIVQKLRDSKVAYRVTGNGTAVEVPSRDVSEVRLNLAGQGLPQGGNVGFEIFDRNSLGVTDFSQKMSYQRALQGELQRTISAIDGVSDARVHVVIPDESLYTTEQKDASASVMLRLNGAARPSEEQVSAIVNLVSAAVQDLKPERVTVVDTRGEVLSDGSGADRAGLKMSETQLDVKRGVERAIQSDVETMLDRVVGPGKAVVRVSSRMSFDQKETTSELYEPVGSGTEGIVSSKETTSETYGTGARGVGGIPGTSSNVAPAAPRPPSAQASAQGYERRQESTQYQVSRRMEKTAEAPGKIEQLSLAVMVDEKVGREKILTIQQAAAAAAGIDTARGDKLVVEAIEFPAEEAPAKMPIAASVGKYLGLGRNALAMLMLAVFLFFVKGALSRQTISIEAERTALEGTEGQPLSAQEGSPRTLLKGADPD